MGKRKRGKSKKNKEASRDEEKSGKGNTAERRKYSRGDAVVIGLVISTELNGADARVLSAMG